jgi:hypothetical protein
MQKFKRDPIVGSKAMAILTRYSSLAEQTSSSPSSHSIAIPRKTSYGNSCKKLSAIQRSDKKLWPFWPVTQVWQSRPPCHRVTIPQKIHEKWPTETREKIWARSNSRIKSYCHFDPLLNFGRPDLLVTELWFHSNPKENGLWKSMHKFERDPMFG